MALSVFHNSKQSDELQEKNYWRLQEKSDARLHKQGNRGGRCRYHGDSEMPLLKWPKGKEARRQRQIYSSSACSYFLCTCFEPSASYASIECIKLRILSTSRQESKYWKQHSIATYRCPDYLLAWPFPLICKWTLYTSQKDLSYILQAESFTP